MFADHPIVILWIVLGIILIIAEIFTLGFVIFWFGIGALAAGLAAWMGFGIVSQFVVFVIVSATLTFLSQKILSKYIPSDDGDALKSAIDSLPGKSGTVVEASEGALQKGAVKVFGSTWTAFPAPGERSLIEGDKVEVVSVEGSSIYVKKVMVPEETKGDWH